MPSALQSHCNALSPPAQPVTSGRQRIRKQAHLLHLSPPVARGAGRAPMRRPTVAEAPIVAPRGPVAASARALPTPRRKTRPICPCVPSVRPPPSPPHQPPGRDTALSDPTPPRCQRPPHSWHHAQYPGHLRPLAHPHCRWLCPGSNPPPNNRLMAGIMLGRANHRLPPRRSPVNTHRPSHGAVISTSASASPTSHTRAGVCSRSSLSRSAPSSSSTVAPPAERVPDGDRVVLIAIALPGKWQGRLLAGPFHIPPTIGANGSTTSRSLAPPATRPPNAAQRPRRVGSTKPDSAGGRPSTSPAHPEAPHPPTDTTSPHYGASTCHGSRPPPDSGPAPRAPRPGSRRAHIYPRQSHHHSKLLTRHRRALRPPIHTAPAADRRATPGIRRCRPPGSAGHSPGRLAPSRPPPPIPGMEHTT